MIVTCERCDTEFQLDDSRVPESGARVRCSRCKHTFMVVRPGAGPEEAPAESHEERFDRAARSALAAAETPHVTEDLPEDRPAERAPAEADESDWEFNADLPAERADARPERAPASQPAEELGSPSEWDIFDNVAAPSAPSAPAAPARASALRRLYVPGFALDPDKTAAEPPSRVVQRTVSAVGWLATASLFAIALWHGLAPTAPAPTAWPAPAPGVALEGVRGRWLDNLHVGRLYVVSGQLRNESASAFVALPALKLELRDGSDQALGGNYPFAEPLGPERLREADAAELASAPALAGSLRGGETRAFEIVAWPLPAEAQRFAIRAAGPSS